MAQGQQSCEPLRCERIGEDNRSSTCPFGGYRTVEDLPLQSWLSLSMNHGARLVAECKPGTTDMEGDGQFWSVLHQCWFACSSVLQNHCGLSDFHFQDSLSELCGARLVTEHVPGTTKLENSENGSCTYCKCCLDAGHPPCRSGCPMHCLGPRPTAGPEVQVMLGLLGCLQKH